MNGKIWILLFVVFIDMVGFGIAIPILPLMISKIGGNPFIVGLSIATYSFFQFIFSPILGRLSDKYGRKPVLVLSSLVNAFSYLILISSRALTPIFLARILGGIGSSNLSVGQAYIADISKSHERTKMMAIFGSIFGIGFALGPFLGGIFSSESQTLPFLITFIMSTINTLLILIFVPESNKNLQKHVKVELFNHNLIQDIIKPKNMKFLFVLFFLINFASSLTYGVFPIFSHELFGWTQKDVGIYFGIGGFVAFLTQGFIIQMLLKRFSEKRLIFYGILLSAISLLSIGIIASVAIIYLATVVFNIGFSFINPNIQGLVSMETLEDEQGVVLGALQSFGSIARVAGPLIGGLVAEFMINMPYIMSSFLIFMIFIWGIRFLRKNGH